MKYWPQDIRATINSISRSIKIFEIASQITRNSAQNFKINIKASWQWKLFLKHSSFCVNLSSSVACFAGQRRERKRLDKANDTRWRGGKSKKNLQRKVLLLEIKLHLSTDLEIIYCFFFAWTAHSSRRKVKTSSPEPFFRARTLVLFTSFVFATD